MVPKGVKINPQKKRGRETSGATTKSASMKRAEKEKQLTRIYKRKNERLDPLTGSGACHAIKIDSMPL